MSIKDMIQNRLPASRRFVERRLCEQEVCLNKICSNQESIIKELESLSDKILETQVQIEQKVQDQITTQGEQNNKFLLQLKKDILERMAVQEEQLKDDMLQIDKQVRNSDSTIEELKLIRNDSKNYLLDIQKKIELVSGLNKSIGASIKSIDDGMIKQIRRPLIQLSYDLTEHCNLNCAGCDHFSPIADRIFTDVNEFERDMVRLSELFNGMARYIHLVGGEPLLHPDIVQFMRIARKHFPSGCIKIITNGVLLNEMSDAFWDSLAELNVSVEVTPYPIKLNRNAISEKAKSHRACVEWFCRNGTEIADDCDSKMMMHMPLNINGDGDPVSNWLECYHANSCICVKHGKIYPCTICPNIEHFNKKFDTKLLITENDYLDIYSDITSEDIMAFLARPISFCRYCDVKNRKWTEGWTQSAGSITEWT